MLLIVHRLQPSARDVRDAALERYLSQLTVVEGQPP
jgi:hypothetical protein